MKLALERDVRLVRFEDGRLEIALEPSAAKTLVNDLSRKLQQWTGRRWMVVVSREQGAPTLQVEQADAQKAELEIGVRADPLVQAVLERFPGARDRRRARPEGRRAGAAGADPDASAARRRRPAATTGNATIEDGASETMALGDFMGMMKQAAAAAVQDAGDAGRARPHRGRGHAPAAAWSR